MKQALASTGLTFFFDRSTPPTARPTLQAANPSQKARQIAPVIPLKSK
jgi:hypothetical protein